METETITTSFAKDVLEGLTTNPKRLSSKYFYDDIGSRIFQEIMEMPEYYLTNSELEILQFQPDDIIDAIKNKRGFDIVELGAGDGYKTKELLRHIVAQKIDCTYYPVDISQKAMDLLEEDLNESIPALKIKPLVGDYFEVLGSLKHGDKPALFLFLGSNIGNYEKNDAVDLLKMFGQYMQPGDHLLIGMDLKKNPRTILEAYDDKHGITRLFNLNLLRRMNRELGANFDLDKFDFYAYYNPKNGQLRSMLVSLENQSIYFRALEKEIQFEANELIWTELSQKFNLDDIKDLANKSGFKFKMNFYDQKKYFADSLWIK
ncbi:MAG: L-histidine N(alpha)-methyltransferase [Bacteroidota bacterium]